MTDSTTAPADPTDHVPQDDAAETTSPAAPEQPRASVEAGADAAAAAAPEDPKPAKRPRATRSTVRKSASGKSGTEASTDGDPANASAEEAPAEGEAPRATRAARSTRTGTRTRTRAAAGTAASAEAGSAAETTPRARKPRRSTTGGQGKTAVVQSALALDPLAESAPELPSGPVRSDSEPAPAETAGTVSDERVTAASPSEAPVAAPSEMAAPSPDAGTDQPDAPVADRAVEAADTAAATPPTDIAAEPAEAIPATAAPASDTAVPAEDTLPPETQDAAPPEAEDAEAEGAPVVAEAEAVPEPPRPIFADLGLSDPVLCAIADMGYRHPTPIQEQAIPYVLMGRDVLGVAQTGTGKTASFTLPMLDILAGSRARARMPRSLILEPTRELALQVAENFVMYGKYLKLTHALIIGGESMSDQKDVLMRGVDVLIATPGRLIDMFERGSILLTDTRILVIDEADRMLDMGFIPDVERIVSLLPRNRQTLFFSATMGPEIRRLADAFLQDPKQISVSRPASVATTITEGLALVAEHDKREALRRMIRNEKVQNALIFCNRKRDVDILYKSLTKHRFSAGALHGDMAQSVRFSTLERFKAGALQLLVCSDVAARGIDIGGLSHVFNFDVPHHAEDYVHRIGRTGRAGLEGHAFTIAQPDDRLAVEAIEKLIGHPIPPVVVEGLDPVDWVEDDGRKRRGRGGPKRKTEGRGAPDRAREERDRGPREDRGPRRDRHARGPEGETAPPATDREGGDRRRREEAPREERRRDESRRNDGRRPEGRSEGRRDEPRREEPRRDEGRRDEGRRDESRREEPRRWEGRRNEGRRDEPRRGRREEDLGPAVLGFGDDVPAFMQLPFRSRRPIHETETEA